MKCTHSWGAYACSGEAEGLLCYVAMGETIPRVDLSCDRFLVYHYKHGGIAVLTAWQLDLGGSTITEWLKQGKKMFADVIRKKVRGGEAFAGAMKNYDELTKKVKDVK